MNPRALLAAAALAAVGVALGLGALGSSEEARAVPELDGGEPQWDGGEPTIAPEKLARAPDGGKSYHVEVRMPDGRTELRVTGPGCVRRPRGAPRAACERRDPFDGGAYDFGEDNRFPVAEAVGVGCQAVACSVWLGEDPTAEEDDRVREEVR